MNYFIKNLDQLELEDNKRFGNKIAYLAEAKKHGIPVLDGFCICFEYLSQNFNFEQLRSHLKQLISNEKKKYIVRSSAQCEDSVNHVFPGVFESESNVVTLEELLVAIQSCYISQFSSKVKLYKKKMDIKNLNQEYFSILVQEVVNPEYSGVLFTTSPLKNGDKDSYFVELTIGHCQNLLQGKERANSFLLRKKSEGFEVEECEIVDNLDKSILSNVLNMLGNVVEKIIQIFGNCLDIEWGYENNNIFIFQIRPTYLHEKKSNYFLNNKEDNYMYGLKAEAMKNFRKLGLFPKKMLIFEAGRNMGSIIQEIERGFFRDSKLTVRFSCENLLGLPRFFSKNRNEAVDFIKEHYNTKWSIIIHESIEVMDSYEVYLDKDKCIMEHIPGMWESDVQLQTDIWIYNKNHISAYMCNVDRLAKYEDAMGIKYMNFMPYTKRKAFYVAKDMEPYLKCLRKNWNCMNGINFHFVKDKQGKIYFLNKRNSNNISIIQKTDDVITEIYSKEDILKWDGKTDLLLKINLKRGEEVLLKEYVPFLKNIDKKIYVEFGILSHPAIMLREMGITVCPLYVKHKKYEFDLDM